MGQANVNLLLELWAASLVPYGGRPPFASIHDMLQVIDSTPLGDAPWTTITAKYMGALPANPPPWMVATYEISHRDTLVCARNMLLNSDFADEFDITPYREYTGLLKRRYTNLMSGDWAWTQAVSFSSVHCGALSQRLITCYRTPLQSIPTHMGQCFAHLFWDLTRPRCQLQLARTTTTPSICR